MSSIAAAKKAATAVIKNGTGAFVQPCHKIMINFCKHSGSSRFVRNYINEHIVEFARQNPSIVIAVNHRPCAHPFIRAEYLNGSQKSIGVKNLPEEKVHEFMMFLRSHNGSPMVKIQQPIMSTSHNRRHFNALL
ncbi:hypothetical protein H696_04844 [Fonticula alba]|uniref:Large ribosomal subunit protein mL43 n=1 Tax=Fonticula alba TaxID=691883 RepID=A0A058Z4X3_FONAL|nr:hypothetical protein H696_04844 [Fonticula alba]KCV68552.1 hypothetical protein H696_04844 [Fonticula alba]|eukprot:XP_009496984.1 hypothetical protein H696_04844 [Fonticula alba]